MDKKNQLIIVASSIVAVIAIIAFGILIVQKIERVVQVAERTETKIDQAIKTFEPVGKAAADKGMKIIENVDEEDLARSAEDGIRELGSLSKERITEWIHSQKVSATNSEIPNVKIILKANEN